MLLPIKPICSKSKTRKYGTSIIFLQYCGPDDKKTLLNTEIAIPPKFWLKRSQSISEDLPDCYGLATTLNDRLTGLLRKAEDIIKYGLKSGVKDIVNFVKACFHPDFDVSTLVNRESESASAGTTTVIKVDTIKALSHEIDLDLYSQFDDYMKVKKIRSVLE